MPGGPECLAIEQIGAGLVKPLAEEFVDLQLAVTEFGPAPSKRVWTSFSGSAITRAAILMERWSLMIRKGRAST